jgi:hypothetical protein
MSDKVLAQMEELLRETFEGARPGEGTQYLDRDAGIFSTLSGLTAEQASRPNGKHPSIASHVRHMIFHLRVGYEWVNGDQSRRDWKASFLPQSVTAVEWRALIEEFGSVRDEYLRTMKGLSPEKFAEEGAGMGTIAHLAYHLGAIRQHLPLE